MLFKWPAHTVNVTEKVSIYRWPTNRYLEILNTEKKNLVIPVVDIASHAVKAQSISNN